jgi:predicted amidohydrolase YtcJ
MTDHSPAKAGLREAHAHLAQHGRAMSMLQLDRVLNADELLDRLANAARSIRHGEWLLGTGLRVESWPEPRWPTAAQLDRATALHPVCLWSFDHHALLVNSPAMKLVGLEPGSPDPPNGRIVRDDDGQPTGLMLEAAARMVWQRVPEPGPQERLEQVRRAAADLRSHGFVEVHDLLAPHWLGPVLARLDDAGELPIRVLLYPLLDDLEQVRDGAAAWERQNIRLAGAKLFCDGTLNSRTAWMLQEYADPLPGLPRGQQMLQLEQLVEATIRVWRMGLGLAVHAIGDAAVRAVLDAGQAAEGQQRRPATEVPSLRIEHAEIIDERDVPRFARLGIIASVQPCHLLTDIEVLERSLPHRLARVLPLRELIQTGCTPGELLLFGSDTPIVRPHPGDSIQAAVCRRREGMAAGQSLAPEQAISKDQAWAAFAGPTPLSS